MNLPEPAIFKNRETKTWVSIGIGSFDLPYPTLYQIKIFFAKFVQNYYVEKMKKFERFSVSRFNKI